MTRIKPTKRTTIYDLAHLAGTSASAVSAVLNGNWKKRRISSQLAEKITRIAEEQGYALNMQASLLRREKSKIIGMIVPKYDNRYFGSIVEMFEAMARERGLFPIITCTRRDPDLEIEAARTMLSYQCDWMVATGATDPDRITEICAAAGVGSLNLDLPGSRAPSVISDNYAGARELTLRVLKKCETRSAARNLCSLSGGAEPITTPANAFAASAMRMKRLGYRSMNIICSPAAMRRTRRPARYATCRRGVKICPTASSSTRPSLWKA